MSYNNHENLIHSAILAGLQLAGPQQPVEKDGIPYVVRPNDAKVESLESLLPAPARIRETVALHDPASFIAYTNNFREPGTVIFFDQYERQFVAVLDYSQGGGEYALGATDHLPEAGTPQWGQHTATYAVRETPEWQVWRAFSGRKMAQAEFAQFIEDHVQDVNGGDGERLQAIALSLEVKKNVSFNSSQRLENGATQLLYSEDVQGSAQSGALTIPAKFTLTIQPYIGGPMQAAECRFRYRLQDRALVLWYEIAQMDKVIERALFDIRSGIEDGTGVHVLAGSRS